MTNFKVSDMNAVYKDDREMSLAEIYEKFRERGF